MMTLHGTADSKDAARAAFGKRLRAWLDYVEAEDLTAEVLAEHGVGRGRRLPTRRGESA